MKVGGFQPGQLDTTVESTPGISGAFEITIDGSLIHSKKAGQGFPDAKKVAEIADLIHTKLKA
eukprot:m.224254 g.224254  ORF g.224254 m.224254 type:complete len:63 (-) comp11064_c0_seq1:189-377(-)